MLNQNRFLNLKTKISTMTSMLTYWGTVHFCQSVIPHMNKGATIVNVSSIRGLPNLASARIMPYSISKVGILSLTIGLAKEYGPDIRVNCVTPGALKQIWQKPGVMIYANNTLNNP